MIFSLTEKSDSVYKAVSRKTVEKKRKSARGNSERQSGLLSIDSPYKRGLIYLKITILTK